MNTNISPIAGQKNDVVLDYILNRRSVWMDNLSGPAPTAEEVRTILTAATHVPDHARMNPWYFIVFEGGARERAGDIVAEAYAKANPETRPDKIEVERQKFCRAPLVIAVVSRIRKGKAPAWEQVLSAGAACLNASLAAHALGFGVNWVTEWVAYDEHVRTGLGLDSRDHIAGFLYIGTITTMPEERVRPDLDLIVNYWSPETPLNKGDAYDNDKFGLPETGFGF